MELWHLQFGYIVRLKEEGIVYGKDWIVHGYSPNTARTTVNVAGEIQRKEKGRLVKI